VKGAFFRFLLPGFFLLLIVGAALLGGGSAGHGRPGSAFSTGDAGRRAAFLLLDELGFEVRAWTREPGLLAGDFPLSKSVLFIAGVPPQPVTVGSRSHSEEAEFRSGRRLRDRRHYLRYMEQGGTIVCHADSELLGFFEETLELDPLAEMRRLHEEELDDLISGSAFLDSGEELALEWPVWPHPRSDWNTDRAGTMDLEVLLADAQERPVAYSLEIERGRLVLLGCEEDPFENDAIAEADHGLLLVRLAEEFAGEGPVLFDEYALGLWSPTSPLELAFAPSSLLFTLHLVFLGVLLFWSAAWCRAFTRDPEVFEGVSPLMRARGFAALLVRHKRFDLLGQLLRRGVLRRLGRRAGRRHGEDDSLRPLKVEEVEPILSALMPGGGRASLRKARAAFLAEPPGSAEALEDLGTELAALEAALHTQGDRK
jgi:hypothetical protein